MGFGDKDRPGLYGPQTSGGRRSDMGSRDLSIEAMLASFETILEQHTGLIGKMVDKVDEMDKTLVKINTQMGHLVTKEACSEGRKELAEDLKARMDGDREITGVGITVPKLWQQYVEMTRGQSTPPPTLATSTPASTPSATTKGRTTPSFPPPPKGTLYYVKAISSIVSLVFAVITITFFAFKMVTRLDQQQETMQQQREVMQDIQRNLKQIETAEQGSARRSSEYSPPQPRPPVNSE
jgi:TolA-binding protein